MSMAEKEAEASHVFSYVLKNDPEEVAKKFQIEHAELLSEGERITGLDIIAEYQKKYKDLEKFMKREYMIFNAKINNCLLNRCYNDIYKPRNEIRDCAAVCTQGIQKADKVVKDNFDLFTTSFSTCLETAQKSKKNIMQESFECYDTMLNTFESLKREIRNEFKYYE